VGFPKLVLFAFNVPSLFFLKALSMIGAKFLKDFFIDLSRAATLPGES
jgi:hypothetical protein